jgi:hypothetical protein
MKLHVGDSVFGLYSAYPFSEPTRVGDLRLMYPDFE